MRHRESADGAKPARRTLAPTLEQPVMSRCRVPAVNGSKRIACKKAVKQGGTAEQISVPTGAEFFHFYRKERIPCMMKRV